MARQPKQVHIFLYHKSKNDEYEYSIFQRSDDLKCWQGICGGVEDGESIEEGALREIFEEAGISQQLPLYKLDSISYLPSNIFYAEKFWGKDIVVVPMYFFAMPYEGEVKISEEHTEFRWCSYEDAEELIYYNDQKVALWELNQRLIRNNLIR